MVKEAIDHTPEFLEWVRIHYGSQVVDAVSWAAFMAPGNDDLKVLQQEYHSELDWYSNMKSLADSFRPGLDDAGVYDEFKD